MKPKRQDILAWRNEMKEFHNMIDGIKPKPFISGSCIGENCSMCGEPATKKVEEHIAHDDPEQNRHGLTAYVCEKHFNLIMCVGNPTRGDRFVEKTEQ